MTEREKRQTLRRVIRIQWLIILVLIIVGCAVLATRKTEPAKAVSATPEIITTAYTEVAEPEYTELGEFKATAYCPCAECCGIWSAEHTTRRGTEFIQKTASGTIPEARRTIAVDPSIIPLGTTVYIDGCEYVAEDKGGAIKGNRIDIFFATHKEALNFGVQTKKIYIIKEK